MEYFQDTFGKISFHGLSYLGDKNVSGFKKIFWLVVFLAGLLTFTFLARDTISDFLSTKTKIQIAETHASLSEVVFPSVVVCNNNKFRRSFVQGIVVGLRDQGDHDADPISNNRFKRKQTEEEQNVFDLMRDVFFEGPGSAHESINTTLLDGIIESNFIKSYLDDYLAMKNITHLTERHQDRNTSFWIVSFNFVYFDNSDTKTIMKNFVAMAGQWKYKQMIPNIEWKGALDRSKKVDEIIMDLQMPTATRICAWIAPLAYTQSEDMFPNHWPHGVISGENNGLLLSLDTEAYDYVENAKGGLGFSLSVGHPFDMPIMEQSGINIQPGAVTKLGVSSTLLRTTDDAVKRFKPYERKCWVESEIRLKFVPYEYWYQYSMSNCLLQAALQEAHRTCDCIPSYILDSGKPCYGKKLRCYFNIIERIGLYTSISHNGENKTCLAACQSQSYQVTSSSSLYPVPTTFEFSSEFCNVVRKIFSACQDERKTTLEFVYPSICQHIITVQNYNACEEKYVPEKINEWTNTERAKFAKIILRYTQENYALVNIFIKDPFALKILIQPNAARFSWISSLGGILGLCIGGSLISVVEIFYHIVLEVLRYHQRKLEN